MWAGYVSAWAGCGSVMARVYVCGGEDVSVSEVVSGGEGS